jgi:hypothetical protein
LRIPFTGYQLGWDLLIKLITPLGKYWALGHGF